MKIYHNSRCRKSREALKIIQLKGINIEIVEYLKNPIDKDELRAILKMLKISAFDLIRKNESVYKKLYKGKNFSNEEWLEVILSNPILMERPIIIKDNCALIARPSEKVLNLID
tara:strand:+ start:570 stop:911 length:342 start_codon:yes stop_codon:yes gene_type:complete